MTQTNLAINPQRLWDAIMETAKYGATPKGGIKRLTVSDEDKKVRDWFRAQCEKLGCAVKIDSCGNMFATRPEAQGFAPHRHGFASRYAADRREIDGVWRARRAGSCGP
jgi:N-carbamoyl-L-amino-acid hydrolase